MFICNFVISLPQYFSVPRRLNFVHASLHFNLDLSVTITYNTSTTYERQLKVVFTVGGRRVGGGGGRKAHCNKNFIYVFLFWELRGLNPNFYIHVSVSDIQYIFPGSVHIFPAAE
jgi:hypothetical protein